jgi:preprotein translocase subunit SecG
MYQVIIVIHVLLGLGIIGLILMQQGKGADAGAAFGTGSAGSVFGAQGAASFLSRATAILATLFFITSLGLAMINGHKGVAFDLMGSPGTQEGTLGISDVGGEKSVDTAPAVPAIKSDEMPAVPEVKSTEQPAGAEIENTVVPKAEEIKTVK